MSTIDCSIESMPNSSATSVQTATAEPAPAAVAPGGRFALAAAISVVCLAVDQATKFAATNWLSPEPMAFWGNVFRLQYALNTGAFLGMAGSWPPAVRFWLLTVLNALFLFVLAGVLIRCWRMATGRFVACVLILSGGIGNLIDRTMNNGQVTDFMNIGLGPVRSGIFNVADMAISAGAVILAWYWAREERAGKSA